jgi:hypothetical protein
VKTRPAARDIPSSLVRASGFLPGENAYVLDCDPAGLAARPVLVLLKAKPENPLGEYAVAKDCRIRVTPAMLKRAGLEGQSFQMDGSEGKIVVRPRNEAATP